MTEEAISYIMQKMAEWLDNNQMIRLEKTLEEVLRNEEIIPLKTSEELLEEFLSVKKLEGRSEKTIFLYRFNIEKVLAKADKNVCTMNADDIRKYLSDYQETNGVCKATLDNVRRNLSSFFRWLEEENLIYKSPLRRIHRIKITSVVRETYGDEELERLRDDCEQIRNLAIIDLLNSTGMRVGEFVLLPSSIHECILVPHTRESDLEMFENMVKEVNATTVDPLERLVDRAYLLTA